MAMDDILAMVAIGRQAIVNNYKKAGRNKLFSCLLYHTYLTLHSGFNQPFWQRLLGVGYVPSSKPCC
jgi:hypothetical protein